MGIGQKAPSLVVSSLNVGALDTEGLPKFLGDNEVPPLPVLIPLIFSHHKRGASR
jgi:hypothetical protein